MEAKNTKLDQRTPPRPSDIDAIPAAHEQSTRNKLANWFIFGALIVIALSLGVILKWGLQSENILTVKNSPFPVRTIRQHAEQGGVVILSVDLCKNTNDVGRVRTSFISSSREVLLPVSEERLGKGCLAQEIPVVVPKDLPADTYKIKFTVTYDINPLKKGIVNSFESREFPIDPSLPTTP